MDFAKNFQPLRLLGSRLILFMNKIKLIFFQLLAFLFIVNGIKRFYFAINSEKMDCISAYIKDSESDCWQQISTQENIFEFMTDMQIFPFYAGLYIMVLFLILNVIFKFSWITTLSTFILSFFTIRLVATGYLNSILNSLGSLFTQDTFSRYLIESMIYTLIGLVVLIVSIRSGKRIKKQSRLQSEMA